jgi:ATP-dependent RNA helicase DeaD
VHSPRAEQNAQLASKKPTRLRKGQPDRDFELAPWQKPKPARSFEPAPWQKAKPGRNFEPAPWQKAKPGKNLEAAPWQKAKPGRNFEPAPVQGEFQNGDKRPTRSSSKRDDAAGAEPGYGAFHVSWGENQGADPRRLLAIVCRKGRIHSKDVGVIRIFATSSVVEVRAQVAAAFAKAADGPDSRDPLVRIAPLRA